MATKQDPPKKRIKDLLKKGMSSGDRTSASQSYQSMARGAVSSMLPRLKLKVDSTKKVIPSGKAKPNTAKIDSVKKVTPNGKSKPSIIIKKETKISRPTIGGSIPFPVRPEKKAIIMKKMMK